MCVLYSSLQVLPLIDETLVITNDGGDVIDAIVLESLVVMLFVQIEKVSNISKLFFAIALYRHLNTNERILARKT